MEKLSSTSKINYHKKCFTQNWNTQNFSNEIRKILRVKQSAKFSPCKKVIHSVFQKSNS